MEHKVDGIESSEFSRISSISLSRGSGVLYSFFYDQSRSRCLSNTTTQHGDIISPGHALSAIAVDILH